MQITEIVGNAAFISAYPIRHSRQRTVDHNQYDDGMKYLRGTYNCRDELNYVYLVIDANVEFEYRDGYYADDTPAYETFRGKIPVGVIKLKIEDDGCPVLCFITVHQEYRNQGIATKLLGGLIEWCSKNSVKHLVRTRPSAMGEMFTWQKLTDMLENAGITHSEW